MRPSDSSRGKTPSWISSAGVSGQLSRRSTRAATPLARLRHADLPHDLDDGEEPTQVLEVPVGVGRGEVLREDLGEPQHREARPRQVEEAQE